MGFPTENDHFGVFLGYHYFWKHPYRIYFWHVSQLNDSVFNGTLQKKSPELRVSVTDVPVCWTNNLWTIKRRRFRRWSRTWDFIAFDRISDVAFLQFGSKCWDGFLVVDIYDRCFKHYPIPSMGLVCLPTLTIPKSTIHVGKWMFPKIGPK